MARLLITGAGGYIGTTLVELALGSGYEVIALDRFFFGEDLLEEFASNPKFSTTKKDIRDLRADDLAGVDVVVDLAALSNDPSGELDPDLTTSINHRGRVHVAEISRAAGIARYILASSCSVYGFGETSELTEKSPTNPLTEYARSTFDAERAVIAMGDADFCVSALRNATVYGLSKRMRFDLVVNTMTRNAIDSGKITVAGGGNQWRPLIHVRDVARAILNIAAQPAEKVNKQVFNIGGENQKIRCLAFAVRENLPFQVTIEVEPDNDDKRSYNVSFDKARSVLGFEPKYDVPFAVREIYEAVKAGVVDLGARTVTVDWYKRLLKAEQLVDATRLNGRML